TRSVGRSVKRSGRCATSRAKRHETLRSPVPLPSLLLLLSLSPGARAEQLSGSRGLDRLAGAREPAPRGPGAAPRACLVDGVGSQSRERRGPACRGDITL